MMKERVFLLPAFCMAAEALRETRCVFVYTQQYIYRGKNIIIQLYKYKGLPPNYVIILSDNVLTVCHLLMAEKKRTCYVDSVTNSVCHS